MSNLTQEKWKPLPRREALKIKSKCLVKRLIFEHHENTDSFFYWGNETQIALLNLDIEINGLQ